MMDNKMRNNINYEDKENDSLFSEDDITSINNIWLKQKYEIWMLLEILRSIKNNYIKFNNNIYLVPLNYLFINIKKLLKQCIQEKKKIKTTDNVNNHYNKEKHFRKNSNGMDFIKKDENVVNSFLMNTVNLKDKIPDENLLININNSYLALYPTTENVNVPEVHINEDIDKSFLYYSEREKEQIETNTFYNNKEYTEMKDSNLVDIGNTIIKENEQVKEELYKKSKPGEECEDENEHEINEMEQENNTYFLNSRMSTNNFYNEENKHRKIKNNKTMHYGYIDKKDICNILLYNLIFINKMNKKLNNCNNIGYYHFKYCNFKKIVINYNKYYKMILEAFKSKLSKNYYAYTFGNNENGTLAIGKPSYLKLSPTIGSLGYDKNKKSIKQGNDFWFTNNLQLLPIKIKKICMNEGMISLIDKKHNLYIGGNNTFLGSKSELYFKRVKSKDNYLGGNVHCTSKKTHDKIKIDKFFMNLKLKKIKKEEKEYLDYNSSSGDSDNVLFEKSLSYNGTTKFLKRLIFQNDNFSEFDRNNDDTIYKKACANTMGVSINMIYDNFSSCESDIHSSIDSDDSDATYIKVSDIEEINKNLSINILLNNDEHKSFYVQKKSYSLKKVSIDDINIYNSILYYSSYDNQYLTHILPNYISSVKIMNKYCKKLSYDYYKEKNNANLKYQEKNIHGEKKNNDEYENSQRYLEESEYGKTSKGYYKNSSTMSSGGKVDKLLMENNVNNFKFIYNFIHAYT